MPQRHSYSRRITPPQQIQISTPHQRRTTPQLPTTRRQIHNRHALRLTAEAVLALPTTLTFNLECFPTKRAISLRQHGLILPIVAPVDPSKGEKIADWTVNSLRHQRNRVFFAALSLLSAVTQVTGSRGITKVGRDTGLLAPGSWSIPLPRLQKEQA